MLLYKLLLTQFVSRSAFGLLKKPPPIVIMPIQANVDGILDIENATLRSRNIVSLTNMVAGNDVVRGFASATN